MTSPSGEPDAGARSARGAEPAPSADPGRGRGPDAAASERPRRPGRPRLEEADAGDVRERLLDAATELAAEQGFDSCGLREIAARAEVSPGMIAYYFGDRRGLHDALFERAFDRVADQVRRLMQREGPADADTDAADTDAAHATHEADSSDATGDVPEADRLDGLLRIHVGALESEPWLPKLLAQDVLSPRESALARRVAETGEGAPVRTIVDWIEGEQARGGLREDLDPLLLAVSIASLSVFPYLVLPIVGPALGVELDGDFAQRLVDHNREVLTRGIRARRTSATPTGPAATGSDAAAAGHPAVGPDPSREGGEG